MYEVETMEETVHEPAIRMNRKMNFKGERAWEYTVRADTIEEIKKLDKQALEQAQKNDLQVMSNEG